MGKTVWIVFLFVSITAGVSDCLNAVLAFTINQSWEQENVLFALRIIMAISLAALSWAAPIEAARLFARGKRWQGLVIFLLAIGCTLLNMANSKAYVAQHSHFIDGVSGSLTISTPWFGTLYHTADWYNDLIAYFPPLTLLSMVVVNLEGKKKLTPAEERAQMKEQQERLENAKWYEENVRPLETEAAKNAGSALRGKLEGRLVGMGLMKEKPSDEAVDEPQGQSEMPQEEVGADRPVEAVLMALAPEQLTTLQVAKMFGLKSDRSVRARIQNFVDGKPNGIPAHKIQIEGRTTPQWIIYRDELKDACPKDWADYERREKDRNRRKKSRTRDNNPATEPVEIHAAN